MAKKHKAKNPPRHMEIDKFAKERRQFGHGRPPANVAPGAPQMGKGPLPGQHEFDANEEQQMRAGHGAANEAAEDPAEEAGESPQQEMAEGE